MSGISAHVVPGWFGECRYGMFVHANIASVPAFSPVHAYADWYWQHWSDRALADAILQPPNPLPEVAQFHRERFPDVAAFDDFIPALTYERWDAGEIAALAVDAGMRYVVHVTKHHDGFCWWDSALTDRTSAKLGPRRDVVAELADASRAAGLVFGTYYSLLDWWHPAYPDVDAYVDAYMRPQIAELIDRFEPAVIWGDGHWGHNGAHWRADQIVEEYYAAMSARGLEAAVNDRFNAGHADFVTYEYDVPAEPPDRAWELCRGIAYSFCFNRAEEDDDHLSAPAIVALLTETVAKGGNLLLNIGPRADGTVPEIQARVLRESGEWVRAHGDAIHGSRPFSEWGDSTTRYTVAGDTLFAIDVTNAEERVFPALHGVTDVDGAADWVERDDGLHVRRDPAALPELAAVYRVVAGPRARVEIREPPDDADLAARLTAARSGETVEIAPGVHPVHGLKVPSGVTLCGSRASVLDGEGRPVLELGAGAGLVGITVRGGAPGLMFIPPTTVTTSGDGIEIRDCALEAVQLGAGADHVVEGNDIVGGNLWSFGAERITVRGNRQHGLRWGTGIDVIGGSGHVIEGNDVSDDMTPIRLTGSRDSLVRDNQVRGRWWGIHLKDTRDVEVGENRIDRTMRAVCVEGGVDNRIEKNTASRCDTGVLVEQGATGTSVADNRLERCRVGTLVWASTDTSVKHNEVLDSREHDHVEGP